MVFRRCPTLPRGLPRSTIGAGGLNFRVRDGTGCFPFAVAAGNGMGLSGRPRGGGPCPGNCTADAGPRPGGRGLLLGGWGGCQVLGLLVPVSCAPCGGCTSGLSTQSSGWGPYHHGGVGGLILRRASRLDAFSGYLFRT